MTIYNETTIYKLSADTIKYLGKGIFEITPSNKDDFPIPFKVRKESLFWEVFDNDLLEDGNVIPEELSLKLNELLINEQTRIKRLDQMTEDLEYSDRGVISLEVVNSNSDIVKISSMKGSEKFKIKDNENNVLNIIYQEESGSYFVVMSSDTEEEQSKEVSNIEMIEILNNFQLIIKKEDSLTVEESYDEDEENEDEFYDEDDFF
jgi:hypothetical protein